jgi:hypothetical protein
MAGLAGRYDHTKLSAFYKHVESLHRYMRAKLTFLAEWEPRPTSPSSIRLIHFGRMLDDKSPLKGKLIVYHLLELFDADADCSALSNWIHHTITPSYGRYCITNRARNVVINIPLQFCKRILLE